MKIIIAGGRDYADYKRLKKVCKKILAGVEDIIIVSGEYDGADTLGEDFAREHGYQIDGFPADWDNLGDAAGPIRNQKMAQHADALIAFWNLKSTGTKNMIDQAKKCGLSTLIVVY